MKEYSVTVQHVYSKTVYVTAGSEDDARDAVEQLMCEDKYFWDSDYYNPECPEQDNGVLFEEDWFIEEAE